MGAGAVGLRGKLFRLIRSEVQLIKIDPITEEPLRDKKGYCVKVRCFCVCKCRIVELM